MSEPEIPTVSVVIPTHDRWAFLSQAVGSALAQRSVGVEVIVVDDGSTDVTPERLASFEDHRVRWVRHERPRGVAAARNAGVAAAATPWTALLDDDDLWSPEKLARQLQAAETAGAVWVYAGVVEVDGTGRLLGGAPPPTPDTLGAELRRRNVMPAGSSNVLVRTEVLRSVGTFDVRLRHLADWDMWLRLAAVAAPACVPAPLVGYRIHQDQATLDTDGMMEEARLLHERHGIDRNSIRRWLAWTQLRHGRRLDAVRTYAGAVAAGDASSLARAAAAALPPRPTALRPRPAAAGSDDWAAGAERWLPAATAR
jgi:glycosyltransferase involved in cell wall biosynthesis